MSTDYQNLWKCWWQIYIYICLNFTHYVGDVMYRTVRTVQNLLVNMTFFILVLTKDTSESISAVLHQWGFFDIWAWADFLGKVFPCTLWFLSQRLIKILAFPEYSRFCRPNNNNILDMLWFITSWNWPEIFHHIHYLLSEKPVQWKAWPNLITTLEIMHQVIFLHNNWITAWGTRIDVDVLKTFIGIKVKH